MKKIILLLFALLPIGLMAQKKEIEKTAFEVNGVCGMCKARIEKTAFGLKGVKTANWEISSHQFTVVYDANKIKLDEIHQAVAAAGHDTPLVAAPDEVYENLPMCCLYERKKQE